MLRCNVKPYEGDKEFIFISYSHKDNALVFPVIEKLAENGFRVWYDEGIDPGSEWPETIAEHLSKAYCVIAFISNNSINSNECKREISFALRKKINFISIFLEPTELSPGMEMQLSAYQAIIKHMIPSDSEFYSKLFEAKVLSKCREEIQTPPVTPVVRTEISSGPVRETPPVVPPVPQNNTPPAKTKKKKFPWIFIVIGVLAIAIIIGIIAAVSGNKTGKEDNDTTPTPAKTEKVEMSDELSDFTFKLNGVVYQLPFAYTQLVENGWTITSSGISSDSMVTGSSYEYVTMANDGKKITAYIINLGGDSKAIRECKVGGIECELYQGIDFSIAKGITCDTTVEKIREAFGTPSSTDSSDDHTSVRYIFGDNNYVRFYIYDENSDSRQYSSIEMKNYVADENDNTQTNDKVPKYLSDYKAPKQLGEDIVSGIFNLDGKLYELPAPVSEFFDDGWTFASSPGSIVSGGKDSAELEKNGIKIDISLRNFESYQTIAENCAVIGIDVDEYTNDELKFSLPGGLNKGLTKAETESILPDSFDYYNGTYSDSYTYSEYKDRDFYLNVTVSKETGKLNRINLKCDTWKY